MLFSSIFLPFFFHFSEFCLKSTFRKSEENEPEENGKLSRFQVLILRSYFNKNKDTYLA
jgi:hypothetical protein